MLYHCQHRLIQYSLSSLNIFAPSTKYSHNTQYSHSLHYSLFNLRLKKMDQKKNTTFKNSTLNIGGQKAIFTAVAGTHNFQLANMVST
mmetsp:Transcript_1054/g.1652  ORF Transcript_1054/g.1652 Transcript_1054/m.1652 type:complete len:88 (+) Transcript_1054:768-1031(+)